MIKEIAEILDIGMVCFYHKTNNEMDFYPDELRNPGYDKELWTDVIKKVDDNYSDYIGFEGMRSYESFKVMESFIDEIEHIPTHNNFIRAISQKKPFSHFNQMLLNYPKLREQWFKYKLDAYMEYVKEQAWVS